MARLHEYQGKAILAANGFKIPRGRAASQEEEKLSWSDPWLQSIDLEYHNVDLERGLYYELARQGATRGE